jgi:hypothetical protein
MRGHLWTRVLLRCYPRSWRERYGEELEGLLAESGSAGSWRGRLDIALAGGRESIRQIGVGARDASPGERVRSGGALVLCAWSLFVVAGAFVQKYSEHWQDVTPQADRAVPGVAFDALVVAAGIGTVLVLAGVGIALPALYSYLRAGGWPNVRGPIVHAAWLTLLTIPSTMAIVTWAHHLTDAQRTGGDTLYAIGVLVWLCIAVSCLAAWTVAAVRTSLQLRWPSAVLRAEAGLAAAVTATMAAMTVATTVWWAEQPSPLAPALATLLMAVATTAGVSGTVQACRALPQT